VTEPLLTPEEIAELVGMSYHGVLRDIRSGKLKATKKGKGYHVRQSWFDEWLEADVVVPIQRARPAPVQPVRRGPAPAGSVERLRQLQQEADAA
jgi:excisionase family DNA binding protein